ncbi:hypothetical protein AB0J43_05185, partial [Nonomuraea fuscirosea]
MITVVGWDGSELSARAVGKLQEAGLVVAPAAVLGRLRLNATTAADGSLLEAIDGHLEHGEGPAVVVAEGDPGFFGVVRTLRAHDIIQFRRQAFTEVIPPVLAADVFLQGDAEAF